MSHLTTLTGTTLLLLACGARSTLLPGDPPFEDDDDTLPPAECTVDAQCAESDDKCAPILCLDGRCVRRITVCGSDDPCEIAACDPDTGECVRSPATFDLDGDGHRGPLPGKAPGAPDACGDDCDDTRADAYPGGVEVCDSVDNDCNGIVDDGAGYAPPPGGPSDVRVSASNVRDARANGLAHDGSRYFAAFTATEDKTRAFGRTLRQDGEPDGEQTRISRSQSDTYALGTVWTGDRYGVLWESRRDNNFEVYFATFDRDGKKRAEDVRVSYSEGFSINGTLVWTGTEFVAVWQDGEGGNSTFGLYGQRISLDGALIDDTRPMVVDGESPAIAVGRPGLGLVFTSRAREGTDQVYFQPFDYTLRSLGLPVRLSASTAQYPTIVWNDDRFVVAWDVEDPPFQVFGATIDGLGDNATAPAPLTSTTANARFGSLLPLGDRLILVYSDSRDGNRGYELYTQTLEPDLRLRGAATRITNHPGSATGNVPVLGPEGDIGVLFSDQREGTSQTYFTRLICRPDSDP